jgi:hypothetical protein
VKFSCTVVTCGTAWPAGMFHDPEWEPLGGDERWFIRQESYDLLVPGQSTNGTWTLKRLNPAAPTADCPPFRNDRNGSSPTIGKRHFRICRSIRDVRV